MINNQKMIFVLILLVAVLHVSAPMTFSLEEKESLMQMYISGPIQRIADSIINPMNDYPVLPLNMELILKTVKTGDVIIENNQAYPQWHAIFGALVPNLRYVHCGMVISGRDLILSCSELSKMSGRKLQLAVFNLGRKEISADGVSKTVSFWEKSKVVVPDTYYVISPEYMPEYEGSKISAMELKGYLLFPDGKACTKALQLRRPIGIDEKGISLIRNYLTYHTVQQTSYDNNFRVSEKEIGINRDKEGNVSVNFEEKPVPLYCTEIAHRALRFANHPGAKLVSIFDSLPKTSENFPDISWWNQPSNFGGNFVVADGFIAYSHFLYANAEPVSLEIARKRAGVLKPIQHEWRRTVQNLTSVLKRNKLRNQ
ncbi:MAG: hypothetical protein HQM10_10835 [Candidatus Riflebacteria bacterium]|nr:hypothetical protein [Candidatus Riflebacteria bacterium]